MSDPERIIRGPKGALETALLRSVRRDAPPAQARARTLATLGISATAGTVVTATAKVAGAVATAKSATTTSIALAAKWIVVGVGAAALTVGVAREMPQLVGTRSPVLVGSGPATQAASPVEVRKILVPSAPEEPAERSESAPQIAPAVRMRDKDTLRHSNDLSVVEQTRSPSKLADEVSVLDQARTAAIAQNPARTLRLLDNYQRQFPNGALGPEAQVMRIEALVQSGQSATALPIARQLLKAAPAGPHAERIRALLPMAESTGSTTIGRSNQTDHATSK